MQYVRDAQWAYDRVGKRSSKSQLKKGMAHNGRKKGVPIFTVAIKTLTPKSQETFVFH